MSSTWLKTARYWTPIYERLYHTYIKTSTPGKFHCMMFNASFKLVLSLSSQWHSAGTVRIPLGSPNVIGVAESRGPRR